MHSPREKEEPEPTGVPELPLTLDELEEMLNEEPSYSRLQGTVYRFSERVGVIGVMISFSVAAILGSELITLLFALVLPIPTIAYVLSCIIPLLVTPPLSAYALRLVTEANRTHERNLRIAAGFRALALADPLTGVLNRRGLFDWVEQHEQAELVLAVADIDRFKALNDAYGHQVGDRVLIAAAGVLRDLVGAGGVVARTGGDEFVVVTRRLGDRPSKLEVPTQDGVTVTLTLGWAEVNGRIDEAVAAADEDMYATKATPEGTNPVTMKTPVNQPTQPAEDPLSLL